MAKDDSDMATPEQAAYEATLPEMLAIPAAELRWPSRDPRAILDEALGCGEEVVKRLGELEAKVGHKYPVGRLLSLERYALATMHAYKAHRANPPAPGSLAQLVEDALSRRGRLAIGCDIVFTRKPHLYDMLKDIDGSMEPEAIAYDVFLLRRSLIQSDPETHGARVANHEELAHAEHVASTLLQAATTPHLRPTLVRHTADMYYRAYKLTHLTRYEAELAFTEIHNAANPDERQSVYCSFCDGQATMLCEHQVLTNLPRP